MNQLIASTFLSAIVLAVVYLFLRVVSLEQQIKSLRARAPAPELADAILKISQEAGEVEEEMMNIGMAPCELTAPHFKMDNGLYGPSSLCQNETHPIASPEEQTFDINQEDDIVVEEASVASESDEDEELPPVALKPAAPDPFPTVPQHEEVTGASTPAILPAAQCPESNHLKAVQTRKRVPLKKSAS